MLDSQVYIPGRPPDPALPLSRYLPPVPEDVAATWLQERMVAGAWVLDPFGASPRLAVEIARQGYRICVAANNPIARFLLEMHASPISASEFMAALDVLSASQVGNERLEPHLRALYQTNCAQCGSATSATSFVWKRETNTLTQRIYSCPQCRDSGERPVTTDDLGRASPPHIGMHRARAIERVAALHDPDREHAEEALSMYTPRAVYALFTLVNKLDSLPAIHKRPLQALLLYAFDHGSSLWAHPPSRARPRQLSIPPVFSEKNIWMCLEEGITAWSRLLPEESGLNPAIPLTIWPELPPESGGICVFEGRFKDLEEQLAAVETRMDVGAVLAALPRPNQAFWTLSALWSGWLWGKEATAPFKSVLRRRRYDWGWHVTALQSTLASLAHFLPASVPFLGLIGENEPGFLSAALAAAEFSGLELDGLSMRERSATLPDQAQITWHKTLELPSPQPPHSQAQIQAKAIEAVINHLSARGSPATYLQLNAAVLSSLMNEHGFDLYSGDRPSEGLDSLLIAIRPIFGHPALMRYGGSASALESGQWWLKDCAIPGLEIPLSDRVEMALVRRILQQEVGILLPELDAALCQQFPGLMTPDLDLIMECLRAYAQLIDDRWMIRAQELPAVRRQDIAEVKTLLEQTGERLGYKVDSSLSGEDQPGILIWRSSSSLPGYLFQVQASAVFNPILPPWNDDLEKHNRQSGQPLRRILAIPGSRAGLALYKLRTDPRLRQEIDSHWRILKFRHLRWLSKHENLSATTLDERLLDDPIESSDAQMKLL